MLPSRAPALALEDSFSLVHELTMAARARRRVVPVVVLFALEFASVCSGCEVVTRPIVPGMRFDGTVFTMRMQLDPARGGRFLALGAPSFLFRPPCPASCASSSGDFRSKVGTAPQPPNQSCPAGRPGRLCEYRTIVRSPPRVWTQEFSPFLSGATRGRRNIHPGAPAAVTTTHRPQQMAIVTVIPLFQIPVLGIRKRRGPVIGQ